LLLAEGASLKLQGCLKEQGDISEKAIARLLEQETTQIGILENQSMRTLPHDSETE
tara:strand:- start:906 stop:1073 length:168 start_codon:yes stop_codon:yes gene_type:complete